MSSMWWSSVLVVAISTDHIAVGQQELYFHHLEFQIFIVSNHSRRRPSSCLPPLGCLLLLTFFVLNFHSQLSNEKQRCFEIWRHCYFHLAPPPPPPVRPCGFVQNNVMTTFCILQVYVHICVCVCVCV